jgi:ribosomal protein S18 acetylase RimI-like enzyme
LRLQFDDSSPPDRPLALSDRAAIVRVIEEASEAVRSNAAALPALAPTVRQAGPDDAGAVADLVNLAYRVEAFFVRGPRTTAAEVARLMEQGCFLVLDGGDGHLAAAVYVEVGPERGYFGMLSVAPDMQGAGLGRRLVAVAEAMCEAQGCQSMELQVVNLRTELPPWYRSLGYREAGTTPFDDPALKRPAHFIRMTKQLSAAL